jgi:acyl carrier protein
MIDDIKRQVRNFLEENFFARLGDDFTNTTSLLATGTIDSTGVLELTHFLEKHFNIIVADEEMRPDNLDTLDAIAVFVERKSDAKT